MRTIKFRGKSKLNGEWVYGDLVQYMSDDIKIVNSNYPKEISYRIIDIQSDTVGQFTGLLDKNGKEIYEGDIVEFVNVNLPDCVIVYDNGSFMYRELGEAISLDELRLQFTVQVIANIHENPELLKNYD